MLYVVLQNRYFFLIFLFHVSYLCASLYFPSRDGTPSIKKSCLKLSMSLSVKLFIFLSIYFVSARESWSLSDCLLLLVIAV